MNIKYENINEFLRKLNKSRQNGQNLHKLHTRLYKMSLKPQSYFSLNYIPPMQ